MISGTVDREAAQFAGCVVELRTNAGGSVVSFGLADKSVPLKYSTTCDARFGRWVANEATYAGQDSQKSERGQVRAASTDRTTSSWRAEKTASDEYVADLAASEGARTTDTGLVFIELVAGSGASPAANDTVTVHYHGVLRDGTVFDSSVNRGEPVDFPLDKVIPCWTEALQLMKVGGKARLVCPSEIAYSNLGAGDIIKPGAALTFEVTLIAIEPTSTG